MDWFGSQTSEILALILDLDGTLLDTENATKGILKEFLGKYGKVLVKEKEDQKRLGRTHKESAIAIVKDYNLPLTPDQFITEITPMYREKWVQAKPLPGANRLIMHLHKHGVPFALASNSLRAHIDEKISHQQGWKDCFTVILGSDAVKEGKPAPDLFIEAAKRMSVGAVHCLVIEDSLVGVTAAKAANMKVVAVPPRSEVDSSSIADSVLRSLLEFQPELWGLPPFEDWVDSALPIEPIYFSIQYRDGCMQHITEDGELALPYQVSGLFFGWTDDIGIQRCKVVVCIGCDQSSSTETQKFQVCLTDDDNDIISDQKIQILLVGYIRGFDIEGNSSMDMEIFEEDKCIASAALDLPMFVPHPLEDSFTFN